MNARLGRTGWTLPAVVVATLVVTPVAMLAVSIVRPNREMWRHQWATRLPEEIANTLILLAGVASCTLLVGGGLAWLVTAYDFPGRRVFGWLLVLPLALPSYILGFLTVSMVGFTGPVQQTWRRLFGADAWFPDVQSLWGAVLAFTMVLYPYVYLMTRAALRDQAAGQYFAARTLGAGPTEAARRVVLPMVRPALAGGVVVVMMETLTDFATIQYFDVNTVSVSVFRIWRGSYDRDAAAEIATLLLGFAVLAIAAERIARGRARFGVAGGRGAGFPPQPLHGRRALAATGVCAAVLTAAFLAPVAQLVSWAVAEQTGDRGTPMVGNVGEYVRHSVELGALTVVAAVVVAVVIANAQRFGFRRTTRAANRLSTIGYAVPGPVLAIGVLLALVALDNLLERFGGNLPGIVATGSLATLVYAYAVRFLAPALNSVDAGLEQIPDEMTDSARSLGARPLRTAWVVHTPLARASIASAVVLVAVDALKELPIVLLLRPFGFDTLPVWVYTLASESRYEQAALPSLAIIAVAFVPVVLLSRHLERER